MSAGKLSGPNDTPLPDADDVVSVGPAVIDPGALVSSVASPDCGAAVLFLGTVRDHSPGKDGVTHLEYEAYDAVVESKILEIVAR